MYFFINESSYFIDFLINISGIIVGAIISLFIALLVFQWQRIKKEQSFSKILINILENGECKEIVETIEKGKFIYKLEENENINLQEYKNFMGFLKLLVNPLVPKLPDLSISYNIGTGYVYEIYDLRTTFSYFEGIRYLVNYSMTNNTNDENVYKNIKKIVKKIPEGLKISIKRLKAFEEKSAFKLALKTFLPWYNILDEDFYSKKQNKSFPKSK